MTTTYRPWLPDAAIARRDLGKALADAVAEWSARWFVQARMVPLGPLAAGAMPRTDAMGRRWRVLGNDIAVTMTEANGDELALLALGAVGESAETPADRKVVAAMQGACIDDLCRRLALCTGLGQAERWTVPAANAAPSIAHPQCRAFGARPAMPLLEVVVATGLVVAFAKTGLRPAPPRAPLGSLAQGLSAQPLRLAAALGACTLTLADVAALGEGDILVLDRATDTPTALIIDGIGTAIGTCTVSRSGTAFHLTLLDQPLT